MTEIMSEPYICGKYLEARHCQSAAEIGVISVVRINVVKIHILWAIVIDLLIEHQIIHSSMLLGHTFARFNPPTRRIWPNPKSIRPILLHQWLNPYQKMSGRKGSKSKCIKSNSLFWQKATLDPPLIRFDTQKYFIPSYCTVQKYFCISSFLQIFSTFSMV